MNTIGDLTHLPAPLLVGEAVHRDRDWLVPMTLIAAILLVSWWLMWIAGRASPPLFATYNLIAVFGVSAVGVPLFLKYLHRIHRQGEARPVARIGRDLKDNARRFLAAAAGVQVVALASSSFSAFKVALPHSVPFYLDPALTDLERSLFGTDPWRLSHAVFGWATPVIDRIYLLWLPTLIIAFYAVLLARPSALKTRALVSYALMWPLLGIVGAYLLSSAGPIFEDRLFGGNSGLIAALEGGGANGTLYAYEKLWTAFSDNSPMIGGGISAMPSMHIALATWIALILRSALPRLAWLGWSYVAVIWFGSVHLGWHYVLDGAVGVLGAAAIWHVAGFFTMRPPHVFGARITASGGGRSSARSAESRQTGPAR